MNGKPRLGQSMKVPHLLLCILLGAVGCSDDDFTKIPDVRTELADGIDSYSSVEDVADSLGLPSSTWDVVENTTREPSNDSTRPPFKIFTAIIHNYQSSGQSGKLYLSFFNNRLLETRYYPENLEGYIAASGDKLKNLSTSSEITIDRFTRVWIDTDFEGNKYIGWEDTRLREEFNRWIEKYA